MSPACNSNLEANHDYEHVSMIGYMISIM